ncbi:phage tail assembly chaperone [Pseudomonas quasicaspiana]|uniref:phage tail assembly chaperone n=1 Tax=Pseudomonas quasicaspiana TaxID=2829821 RepID=UPI001E45E39C|nr:phage tail assembly chaperone [Pseudomonas quasicaspiana]MCD5970775.1 phage tail assembly chaperone [Pseudomonas quasicaspiana]
MAKIKIAQTPTFTANVGIPRVGADPVLVEFTFAYLNRLELSALFDKWNQARDAHAAKVKEEGMSWQQATASEIELQVSQIKEIVTGWAFEDKFDDEAITALVTTCVGAPQAVLEAYQGAYNPARLGN